LRLKKQEVKGMNEKNIYEIRNHEGCYFGKCKAESARKARSIFAKHFSGSFYIEGNDGSFMNVNI
jgi:hypothetical protein